ncbi:hypothetical protein [Colwellia sp. Arc7-D]|uniref:hypothetical protein n=1 Tax=Colwellia sp. Arc7-D TaxID=2161872 RepID=UPI000D383F03|nr:hypothetical protein [Colwellia sp. Arc7-D]AWB56216.1 hypothetical protein DBO93_00625 [Colwellia sp. Arc7-D]
MNKLLAILTILILSASPFKVVNSAELTDKQGEIAINYFAMNGSFNDLFEFIELNSIQLTDERKAIIFSYIVQKGNVSALKYMFDKQIKPERSFLYKSVVFSCRNNSAAFVETLLDYTVKIGESAIEKETVFSCMKTLIDHGKYGLSENLISVFSERAYKTELLTMSIDYVEAQIISSNQVDRILSEALPKQ